MRSSCLIVGADIFEDINSPDHHHHCHLVLYLQQAKSTLLLVPVMTKKKWVVTERDWTKNSYDDALLTYHYQDAVWSSLVSVLFSSSITAAEYNLQSLWTSASTKVCTQSTIPPMSWGVCNILLFKKQQGHEKLPWEMFLSDVRTQLNNELRSKFS